ncbi:MAG TPA: 16S rRNA (uracil(1498)-N(3))-methyltransferase [Nitrospiraceae bacterium]|nr:16S rRNA (uracil(1498)-N(3))-methyltransferase [Nitrospiraceae bacterium]
MPKPPRFFITPDQVQGKQITVSGEDHRHIRTVLRKQPGDMLMLSDGQGTEYITRIIRSDRSGITAEITERSTREIRYPRITLGQGLPKSDKMDWIVQKATELGVAKIVPLMTERTIVKVKDEEKRIARWQRICREAAMQSARPDISQVGPITSFHDFVMTPAREPKTLLLLPWEEGTEPIKNVLRNNPEVQHIVAIIGPEGGLSEAEARSAEQQGFSTVSLGPSILRSETAAMAVLSMVVYEYL